MSSLWSLIPYWPKTPNSSRNLSSQEDINYNRMSWGFISFAVGALITYLMVLEIKAREVLEQRSSEGMEEMDVSKG
jgi:hypothetical protein